MTISTEELMTLRALRGMVLRLRDTSSRLEKEAILKEALTQCPRIGEFLHAVYDRWRQFHLTAETVAKSAIKAVGETPTFPSVLTTLSRLERRLVTGHAAIREWKELMALLPENLHELLGCLLNKDLRCHVGLETASKVCNKVLGSPIRDFKVALGEPWEDKPDHRVWEFVGETWYASRKLDGVRCLAILDNGEVSTLSRDGKAFETLAVLVLTLRKAKAAGLDNVVLDGELALARADGKDDFPGLMSQIRRKDHQIAALRFHVFDLIPLSEFQEGRGTTPFRRRQAQLIDFVENVDPEGLVLRRVPQWKVKGFDHFEELRQRVQDEKWEGLILRRANAYLGTRSSDILKVKKMQDLEAKVKGVKVGPVLVHENGKAKTITAMTAATIEFAGNPDGVDVGSGWSKAQRIEFCEHPERLVGATITVQFFERTKDSKTGLPSLRFPVFKWLHGKRRTT